MRFCNLLLLIFCFVPANQSIAQETGNEKYDSDFFVTVGYWNDNFYIDREINNLLNRKIFQVADDFLTTNLWLRGSIAKSNSRWFLDFYFNIITNKEQNFRTDLLSLRLMKEMREKKYLLRYGAGLTVNGNFGGEQFQNGYHKLFGIKEVNLPDLNDKYFGFSFYSTYKPELFAFENGKILGSVSASYLTGGGPAFVEGGVSYLLPILKPEMQLRFHGGYQYYYQVKPVFRQFFEKGFIAGMLATFRLWKGFQTTLWVTANQYGTGSQNHFGISFTFAGNKLIPINIDDIKFP